MLHNYYSDSFGVIHQMEYKPFVYDQKYINLYYNSFKQKTFEMSYLRLGYLLGSIKIFPQKILDYGYGNGAFLEICQSFGIESYGTDISGYPIPKNCHFIHKNEIEKNSFDVICFFDCLEHIEDIEFIASLNTKYIYISLPWCHHSEFGDEWFKNWKHRKPNEHLHHFNDISLINFMKKNGYSVVIIGNPEDCIRKSNLEKNILSGIFVKDD